MPPPSPRHAITPAVLLLLAGCSNPLFPKGSDYGRQTPPERLRQIDTLPLQQYARPTPPPGSDAAGADPVKAAKARFEGLSEAPLTLEEVRASALEHNLDLKVAVIAPAIARESISVEESRFEAAFTTRALWQNLDPSTTAPFGIQQQIGTIEPGVRIPLRSGGTAIVSLPISRAETTGPGGPSDTTYGSDLDFSISQPLLRNAGREVNTTAIRIASYNRQISEAQTKLAIINQLAAADRAYWQYYQARRNLEVTQQQYDLAQAQLDKARRMVNAGKQAEIEVIRAQAGLAQRLDSIIVAQNRVLSQERELKRLINMPGLEIDAKTVIIPKTEPAPVEYLIEAAPLTKAAVENRMEMLELELQLLSDIANIKFNQNQLLPALDLTASYGIGGLGTTTNESFSTLGRNRFDSWSVGANLEVPLGNEGPKARLRQSILGRLQRLGTRESRKLLIRQEVADTVDRIQAGWQLILATRQATISSARSLQAEQRQFDVGASTSTDVLDAATRLALAQLEEIQALVDYQIAQVDLAAATGNLLGAAHIRWDPVSAPAPKVTPDLLQLPGEPPPVTGPEDAGGIGEAPAKP